MADGFPGEDEDRTETDAPDALASLKELVLDAGSELLDQHGLSLTFQSISYAKVFDHLWSEYEVTVTRGSVHERIWSSQDDFRRDVLAESVAYFPRGNAIEAITSRTVASAGPVEFARDLGSRMFPELIHSQMSDRFQSVKALASWFDDPLATETLHRLLDERAEAELEDARAQFPATLRRLGLRPRLELGLTVDQTVELLSVLLAALTEGGQLNYHAGSHDITATTPFMSTPGDDDDPWRVLSVGIKSILDLLYEPGPAPQETADPEPRLRPRKVPKVEPNSHVAESGSSRRPRSHLRELVLTAAVELLLRDGPQLKPESLNYQSVLAHLKQSTGITVHRSSVHPRVWPNNDDFRLEVLARSLEVNSNPVRTVTEVVEHVPPVLAPDRTVDRQHSARRLFRLASASLPGLTAGSLGVRRLLQVKAALIDQQDSRARTALRAAVAEVERQRMEGNKIELQTLVLDLGFRARPETGLDEDETLELFEVLTMTTAAGVMFNELAGVTSMLRPHQVTYGPGSGETEEWTPMGIAMWAYFEQLYEEIPQ